MYTIIDVKIEINRYFTEDVEGNNQDIIDRVKRQVDSIYPYTDILRACHQIRESFVDITDADGKLVYKEKKYMPNWVRYLVYLVIYDYLSKSKVQYSQSDLLIEMGLYSDIFGKKNWGMLSPAMELSQSEYIFCDFQFNHAEVESNEVFRAMIHHMICNSRIFTDCFVDVFGKLGIIPISCANGYEISETWLDEKEYKSFILFRYALSKKLNIKKSLKKIQLVIQERLVSVKEKDTDGGERLVTKYLTREEIVSYYKGLLTAFELRVDGVGLQELERLISDKSTHVLVLEMRLAGFDWDVIERVAEQIKVLSDRGDSFRVKNYTTKLFEWCEDEGLRKKYISMIESKPDIYKFASYYILEKLLGSEYWKNNQLTVLKSEDGTTAFSAEQNNKGIVGRINNFLDMSETELEKLVDSIYDFYKVKRFKVIKADYKSSIYKIIDAITSHEYEKVTTRDDVVGYGYTDLLYLDPPKYIHEWDRYGLNNEWFVDLLAMLRIHKGDWILSWKTFVEFSKDDTWANHNNNYIYSELYTAERIVPSAYERYDSIEWEQMWAVHDKKGDKYADEHIPLSEDDIYKNKVLLKEAMLDIYDKLLEISGERQLYVFKYRPVKNSKTPDSIIFITTIDFTEIIDETQFEKKYMLIIDRNEEEPRKYFVKEKYEDFYINMKRYINKNL